jgi:hypothetical protein
MKWRNLEWLQKVITIDETRMGNSVLESKPEEGRLRLR